MTTTKRLKLKYDQLLSSFAFKSNLRRYAAAPPFVVMKLTPRVKEQWPTPFPRAQVRPHVYGGQGETLVPPHTRESVSLSLSISLSLYLSFSLSLFLSQSLSISLSQAGLLVR